MSDQALNAHLDSLDQTPEEMVEVEKGYLEFLEAAYQETRYITCGTCGTSCKVKRQFVQATRKEPVRFLCWQAYCPECQVAWEVSTENTQLEIRERLAIEPERKNNE